MTTELRIQLLARHCQSPEFLGTFSPQDLIAWLQAELGNATVLDRFIPHGPIQTMAIAPKRLLHIVSGNSPHGAMQSVLRGLLLGSMNEVKLPSGGLPELKLWVDAFPDELQQLVNLHDELPDALWKQADAVIAIGSDTSIEAIHDKLSPWQRFIPHGHKVSMGVVYSDFKTAAARAARDVSLFNQRGCLSPHAIYVDETKPGDRQRFASLLAKAMQSFNLNHPPSPLSLSEAGAIRNLRETYRFLAANDRDIELHESKASLDWTVISEPSITLKLSCLNRCVYVKPLPQQQEDNIHKLIGDEAAHLSTVAIHPYSDQTATHWANSPASRICPMGESQSPSLFWHHDGFPPLASLLSWKDIG
ncbi:hypothetical protein HW115_01940 [Verrucomicrobiaceae bacterium N1E253]|uniref:Long-chain-fatty-acyl-CoA reductase n=1 Tax=Oceaniferula marina TaxID=2748318 RepID=A0A851GGH0_9BACT|nr:acyl-CoA reductase [Oceaniferula marina]NWK54355.1 hypothetical protein [Oceaniferula marina]